MHEVSSVLAQTSANVQETLLLTHVLTWVGFALALLVFIRMLKEQRNPRNVYAWGLLVLFVPWLGVPLYLVFGGRKIRRLIENKRRVQNVADAVAARAQGDHRNQASIKGRYGGNAFELHGDGIIAYRALRQEILQAKESINIVTYILGNDVTGRAIVDLLAKRAREGIEVRLLIDALGSLGRAGHFVEPLRRAGGRVERFMPVLPICRRASANLRNHRKIAIFDHRRALVGGQNLDNRFMGETRDVRRFHDFNALIQGPAVAALNHLFVSDWCYASGENPECYLPVFEIKHEHCGDGDIEVVGSGPDVDRDLLWERIVLMIQECREDLVIVTPYFIPDEVIFQSLLVKAAAGYRMRIIVPLKSNQPVADFARGHYLRKLHEAGADIQFYAAGMKHAKLMISDGKVAMMGSANIDMRSLFLNFEVGVFHYTKSTIHPLESWVADILPRCIPYSQTPYAQASRTRLALEESAKLLVPLL